MKANLTQREPQFLERWEKADLYGEILKRNRPKPRFVLHDGPPYANGSIHLGHVMNKTLKDIIIKSKSMSGFYAAYVPGWDCHGLPIEHQVLKELGSKGKELSKAELRKKCRAYAEKFVSIQRDEFKRLGVFGDWEHPYRTMDYPYQAQIVREFGKIVERGFVYRTRKAIHWCMSCKTALAEAEIEYAEHRSPSVYVAYPIVKGWEEASLPKTPAEERFAVIWTTTPWTLPASMAIAYNPEKEYVAVEFEGMKGRFVMAKALVKEGARVVGKIDPSDFSKLTARHPFLEREIRFFPGDHVTMDAGTGLVHTAPGHGEDDYEVGLKHGIDIYSPVKADGTFDETVEKFAGLHVFKANPEIIAHLKNLGRLVGKETEVSHSYPHCWRCKNPLIFRATEQWFLKMSHDNLRKRALDEIDRVKWTPAWGRERIYNMIAGRPDWCLSRQRTWGVPIVSFTCVKCKNHLLSPPVIFHVADLFEKEGADIWFEREAEDLMPKGTACPSCKGTDFEKGNDILDVWFDSGASYAAVAEKREELGWPCDVYLEGSDQHRGWFHSSLLEGVASRDKAPYKAVVTHGFVVDGQGKKMSKSLGNYISAQDTIKQKGAEMLRLWVAMEDYRDDVRLSQEILDRVTESYRRIRNTARYCFGNLFDFNPDTDAVPREKLAREVDRWGMERLSRLTAKVRKAYDDYEFHAVVTALNEFCVVDLSSLYLDISKDCLYCDTSAGIRRRSAQTVLYETVSALARLMAPIVPVTAEEIWDFVPAFRGKSPSVHMADFPAPLPAEDGAFMERWEKLLAVRGEVSKALERLRQEKKIGQSLEAGVEVSAPEGYAALLKQYEKDLPSLWIVSRAAVVKNISAGMESFESSDIPGLTVGARAIEGNRCERCWTYAADLGADQKHPALCGRCADVVEKR